MDRRRVRAVLESEERRGLVSLLRRRFCGGLFFREQDRSHNRDLFHPQSAREESATFARGFFIQPALCRRFERERRRSAGKG
jgi:hypothetical protein